MCSRDFIFGEGGRRDLPVGSFVEDVVGSRQLKDIKEQGMEAHSQYGNFVLDEGREVIYHVSGRKVGLGRKGQGQPEVLEEGVSSLEVREGDGSTRYTSARTKIVDVPGVESPAAASSQPPPPSSKFKGRCFQCGQKGHSKNYCKQFEDKGE